MGAVPSAFAMEKTMVITVGPAKQPCTSIVPMECLQVTKGLGNKYQNFYSTIEGFDYQPGYTYRLKVSAENIENAAADASNVKYTLVRTISKRALSRTKWEAVSLNGTAVTAGGTLNFQNVTLSGRLCNSYGGRFTAEGGKLSGIIMSTRMYCDNDLMKVETAMDFNNSSYSVSTDGRTLTVTNSHGDVVVWKKK